MDGQIEEVTLSLSGLTVQWRPGDSRYRTFLDRVTAGEWTEWTGRAENVVVCVDGDIWNRPSWCVLVGEIPAGRLNRNPIVRTADGSRMVVTRIGHLWTTEWIGDGKPVTIEFGRAGRELYAYVIPRPVRSD
ncbi:MAG: hypothetical protein JWM76_927 [Pseudonocardiales bacterium]|nr:hypothetical protein [Pseudonocardiales bacterium]